MSDAPRPPLQRRVTTTAQTLRFSSEFALAQMGERTLSFG